MPGNSELQGIWRDVRFDKGMDPDIIQRMLNYISLKTESALQEHSPLQEEELARLLKALADPSRLSIFNMLMEGVQCNCEIAEKLGFSLSLISHHLRVLREVGLVRSERDAQDGRWIYYSIDRARLAQLEAAMQHLLDVNRIQPRTPSCGPKGCEIC
jgi:ArsR family transcriptional regulator